MGRAIAAGSAAHSNVLPKLGSLLAKFWLELTAVLFDGYRPELHYMRGPGPAYRAKHGSPKL